MNVRLEFHVAVLTDEDDVIWTGPLFGDGYDPDQLLEELLRDADLDGCSPQRGQTFTVYGPFFTNDVVASYPPGEPS